MGGPGVQSESMLPISGAPIGVRRGPATDATRPSAMARIDHTYRSSRAGVLWRRCWRARYATSTFGTDSGSLTCVRASTAIRQARSCRDAESAPSTSDSGKITSSEPSFSRCTSGGSPKARVSSYPTRGISVKSESHPASAITMTASSNLILIRITSWLFRKFWRPQHDGVAVHRRPRAATTL